jgi:hypothetical protein
MRRIMDMANKTITINGVEIDAEKADALLKRIIIKEKTNIKTKQYNDGEMVKMIKKLIEEVAECY